ncbi:L-rhamnose mutarotase [Flaviaesturariibacter flavus]|uniref:L-rhamnose mutarotase n=1 Tax=Flaviaesturariibacter flavus TaxID=2502780 RepID=A0A4R1BPP3_9BACT|nr:L-rhamnose mutarotase [Flaviaesturariibacter flavus]TCJ19584.1 L-rhamnose mutarotase [Flaviaesturariibacter flavus]
MKRYCLTLDLKDDPQLIAEYEAHHRAVWPEVLRSIHESGITDMQIYRLGARMVMIMETTDAFDFSKKAAADSSNGRVQEWEALMWRYQQALPGSAPGEKWKLMENIFELNAFEI